MDCGFDSRWTDAPTKSRSCVPLLQANRRTLLSGWLKRPGNAAMRETLNATACAALLDDVTWSDPSMLASLSVLAAINVMVIVGNCLVIAAVFCSSKLRSVTNLFIVSLAVADLLVGVAVLPFSATWEIFKARFYITFNSNLIILFIPLIYTDVHPIHIHLIYIHFHKKINLVVYMEEVHGDATFFPSN